MLPPSADPFLRVVHATAGLAARYHRAELLGAERLPAGAALLVGNHGLFGLETPAFFWLLHAATGRLPKGLADRRLFGNALARPLLERVGARRSRSRLACRWCRSRASASTRAG
jgi:hypothetical protein